MDAQKKEKIYAYKNKVALGGVFVIRNRETGRQLLLSTADLQGSQNQFQFSVITNSCVKPALQGDWKTYGSDAFQLEVLEELEQGAAQTHKEFREDIAALEALWWEKLPKDSLY